MNLKGILDIIADEEADAYRQMKANCADLGRLAVDEDQHDKNAAAEFVCGVHEAVGRMRSCHRIYRVLVATSLAEVAGQ